MAKETHYIAKETYYTNVEVDLRFRVSGVRISDFGFIGEESRTKRKRRRAGKSCFNSRVRVRVSE